MKTQGGSFARILGGLLTALCATLLLPCTEARAAFITFLTVDETDVNDGIVAYGGGLTPMGGIIDVDYIVGTDTPLNSGAASVLTCVDCKLTFSTGDRIDLPSSPFLVFAGGGSMKIDGTVPGAGIPTQQPLLEGVITTPSSLPSAAAIDVLPGVLLTAGVFAVFRDFKNAALADYFGLPGGEDQSWAGVFGIGLAGVEDIETGAFLSEVWGGGGQYGAFVLNAPIPEPQTWLLFGFGIAAIGRRCMAARMRRNEAVD